MTIEKTIQGIRISDIVAGHRLSRYFIGYTKTQAIKKWNNELKNI